MSQILKKGKVEERAIPSATPPPKLSMPEGPGAHNKSGSESPQMGVEESFENEPKAGGGPVVVKLQPFQSKDADFSIESSRGRPKVQQSIQNMKIAKKSSSSADVQLSRGPIESFRMNAHDRDHLGYDSAWEAGGYPQPTIAAQIDHFKTALDQKTKPPKGRHGYSSFLKNDTKLPPPVDKLSVVPHTEKNKKQPFNEDELRQTWRSKPMVASNKLPDAFGMIKPMNKKKSLKMELQMKNYQKVQELEKASKLKAASNMLSPIEGEQFRSEKSKQSASNSLRPPHPLYELRPKKGALQPMEPKAVYYGNNVNVEQGGGGLNPPRYNFPGPEARKESMKFRSKSNNPGARFEEATISHSESFYGVNTPQGGQTKVPQGYSTENQFFQKNQTSSQMNFMEAPALEEAMASKTLHISSKLKLEEMINLSIIRSSSRSGPVKKMLHVNSLKVYVVKVSELAQKQEIPMISKEVRQNLKTWFANWEKCRWQGNIVNVHGTFWNIPEGCISVVMDFMNAGSLADLMASIGSVPERALRSIARQIIVGLNDIHLGTGGPYNGLVPSQVLLNRQGQVKLNMGLGSILEQAPTSQTAINFYKEHKFQSELPGKYKKLSMLANINKFAKSKGYKQQYIHDFEKMEDTFDLGFLVLVAAVGGLEIFDGLDGIISQERSFYYLPKEEISADEFERKRPQSIFDLRSPYSQGTRLLLGHFLNKKNYSAPFFDFLKQCLSFNPQRRASIPDLLKHPWIAEESFSSLGPQIGVTELLNISHHSWKQSEFGATAGGGFGELPGLHTNNKFLDSLVNQLECVISVEHIRSLFDSQNHLYGDLEDIASSIGVSEQYLRSVFTQVLQKLLQQNQKN